jgi:acetyl esterase
MRWFWAQYLGPDGDPRDPAASVLATADFAHAPPALVITAEHDPLRDEGEAYAARLRDAGNEVTCSRSEGMIHGFLTMDAMTPAAGRADADIAAFLADVFRRR